MGILRDINSTHLDGEESGISKTATLVVAAYNASDKSKSQCDYLCKGTADHLDIQDAIDALPATGGKIYVTEGNFVGGQVSIPGGTARITIEGAGIGATVYTAKNGLDDDVFTTTDEKHRNLTLKDFTIDGNKANQTAGSCLKLLDSWVCYFTRMKFIGAKEYGLEVVAGSGGTADTIFITDCWAVSCEKENFYFATGAGIRMIGGHSSNSTRSGIWGNATESVIMGVVCDANTISGIVWGGGTHSLVVTNNIVATSGGHGIYILDLEDSIISNNVCIDNGSTLVNTYNGMYIDAVNDGSTDNLVVIGNKCMNQNTADQKYGIQTTSNVHAVIIEGNDVENNQSAGMLLANSKGLTRNNHGYVDESEWEYFEIRVIERGTAVTTGDGKESFFIPKKWDGYDLAHVAAAVTVVSSSGLPTIQIHNVTDTVDMLSTRITIDAGEKHSKDATAPAVIDTGNDDVAEGDEIRIDVDVAGTDTEGLVVEMAFART